MVVDFIDHPDAKPDVECISRMMPDAYKTAD
jgi:hypothetical protein